TEAPRHFPTVRRHAPHQSSFVGADALRGRYGGRRNSLPQIAFVGKMALQEISRMTLAERLDQFLVGKIAFPAITSVLNRHDPLGRYRKLLLTERCSKDTLKERQFQKLQELLRHTNFWSPFYATRFKKAGIVPEDIRS